MANTLRKVNLYSAGKIITGKPLAIQSSDSSYKTQNTSSVECCYQNELLLDVAVIS